MEGSLLDSLFVVVDSRRRRGQLWCRALWWTLFAGPLVAGSIACGETQEEQLLGVSRGNVGDLGLERDDLPNFGGF